MIRVISGQYIKGDAFFFVSLRFRRMKKSPIVGMISIMIGIITQAIQNRMELCKKSFNIVISESTYLLPYYLRTGKYIEI